MKMMYDPDVLVEIATNWLYSANDYYWYVAKGRNPGHRWDTMNGAMDALQYACRMVDADIDVVVSVARSIDRHGIRTGRPALFDRRNEEKCGIAIRAMARGEGGHTYRRYKGR